MLTTQANPAADFSSWADIATTVGGSQTTVVYGPPAGLAAVVTSIHVDVWGLSGSDPFVQLYIGNGACSANVKFLDEVDPASNGETVLPFSPGYVIPAGDALCGSQAAESTFVSAIGYTIPAASAPTQPQSTVQAPMPHH